MKQSLSKLTKAVLKFLKDEAGDDDPRQTCRDAAKQGADAGWPGFTMYDDTWNFAHGNKRIILDKLLTTADEIGSGSVLDLVAGFGCLKDMQRTSLERALLMFPMTHPSLDDNVGTVANALAWFALEEAGHELESLHDAGIETEA